MTSVSVRADQCEAREPQVAGGEVQFGLSDVSSKKKNIAQKTKNIN